jgi:hypothetical protein
MIREDYILRMIQQMGEFIRRILNQNSSQESIEADLEEITGQWIGLPASMLLSLSVDEVYRLFEDSDRMVIEKSYLMSEIYRAKGIETECNDTKIENFERALFFYNKCSGFVGKGLQSEIDKRIIELTTTVEGGSKHANPDMKSDVFESHQRFDRLQSHRSPQPGIQSTLMKKRKKGNAMMFWSTIAACLIGSLIYVLLKQSEIEIVDTTWGFEGNVAHAHFRIVNNTKEERLVRLRLSAEHYTRDAFRSQSIILGAAEREYRIAADSSKDVNESFECQIVASGSNLAVLIEILSNQSVVSLGKH